MKAIETDKDQKREDSGQVGENEDEDSDVGDIEAQIQKELADLKPARDKSRPLESTQLEIPCGAFFYTLELTVDRCMTHVDQTMRSRAVLISS